MNIKNLGDSSRENLNKDNKLKLKMELISLANNSFNIKLKSSQHQRLGYRGRSSASHRHSISNHSNDSSTMRTFTPLRMAVKVTA